MQLRMDTLIPPALLLLVPGKKLKKEEIKKK